MQFHQISYKRHIAETAATAEGIPSVISNPHSIDAHRHARMYEHLRPLIVNFPDAEWLTVGDTGADAYYLKKMGARKVTCSSLSSRQAERLHQQGMIGGITVKEINAEAVELEDESVDFVLCKEAYHHFPRPSVAHYELLRVSRIGVVYIEPAEPIWWAPLDRLKAAIKRIMRGTSNTEQLFEESGNFIYRLSERELEKQATALQFSYVAFAYFNDFWHASLARRSVDDRVAMAMFKAGVIAQNAMAALRLMNNGAIVHVTFKKESGSPALDALVRHGFAARLVPRNPYFPAQ